MRTSPEVQERGVAEGEPCHHQKEQFLVWGCLCHHLRLWLCPYPIYGVHIPSQCPYPIPSIHLYIPSQCPNPISMSISHPWCPYPIYGVYIPESISISLPWCPYPIHGIQIPSQCPLLIPTSISHLHFPGPAGPGTKTLPEAPPPWPGQQGCSR